MANINLLTIHWGGSYGGTMQTYATIKTLRKLGHDVRLVNLIHPKTNISNKYKSLKSLKGIIRELQFSLFRKRFFGSISSKMYSINRKIIPKCDYTVVGSDQVWNSDITSVLKSSYFLDFVNEGEKLSYASSFGKSVWQETEVYTNFVKKALACFKAVSVREESGVVLCKEIFGIKAIQVLDPTLMHENYDEIVSDSHPIHEVFPFILLKTTVTNNICNCVCQELRIPLYRPTRYRNIFKKSPKEWLRRIKNSDFIITDSFHGLAFSLIFHRNFLVLCADEKKFTRLQSLLRLLNMEERYVRSFEDLKSRICLIHKNVDYKKVDGILKRERVKSLDFLKTNLS